MRSEAITKVLYGVFSMIFFLLGGSILLLHTGLLPSAIKDLIGSIGHGDANTLHIMQEFGSLLVFTGMITLWFLRHYERSQVFHWAMTTFWALFALIHWIDARGSLRSITGPIINTIPFTLFALTGLLRRR